MLPQVGNFSNLMGSGLLVLYWKVSTDIKTRFKTIKKIGKDLACILSPTIISGEVSNCKDIPITIIENIVRNNGTV